MKKFECPSCGAAVNFSHGASVFAVCAHCRTAMLRNDSELQDIGKIAALQDDMSPFQCGTQGSYEGKPFTIVGRVIRQWDAGRWTEWNVLFADNSSAWLAEAQGTWMLTKPTAATHIPPRHHLTPGEFCTINHKKFEVTDIKECRYVFSEGELPFQAMPGPSGTCIDLSGDDDSFASIDYSDGEPSAYIGSYCDFKDFKFTLLRRLDGW